MAARCSSVLRMTAFSMTIEFLPNVIGLPSATTQAPNMILAPAATVTSPHSVALGATYADGSTIGFLPMCDKIMADLGGQRLPQLSTSVSFLTRYFAQAQTPALRPPVPVF